MIADYRTDRPTPTTVEAAMIEINNFAKELKMATRSRRFRCTPLKLIGPSLENIRFCRELSEQLVATVRSRITAMDESLVELEEMCRIMQNPPFFVFKNLASQMQSFRSNFAGKISVFKGEVKRLLPKLKGLGDDSEDDALRAAERLAAVQCATAEFFIQEKQTDFSAIEKIMGDLCAQGFKPQPGVLKIRARKDKPGFLINVGSIDSAFDLPHRYEVFLDRSEKPRPSKIVQWHRNQDMKIALEAAVNLKNENDKASLDCDYIIGACPGEEDEGDGEDRYVFCHDGDSWVPLSPPEGPSLILSALNFNAVKATWSAPPGCLVRVVISEDEDAGSGTGGGGGGGGLICLDKMFKADEKSVVQDRLKDNTKYIVTLRAFSVDNKHGVSRAVAVSITTPKAPSLAKQLWDAGSTHGTPRRNTLVLKTVLDFKRTVTVDKSASPTKAAG